MCYIRLLHQSDSLWSNIAGLSLDAMVPHRLCGRCLLILHALQLQDAEEGACCCALPWVTVNLT